MDIKVRPGGLRLKFETHAQPFLGPKFGCKILHFTVQYRSERAACAASGFSRAKTLAENFNCQFGNPDGALILPFSDKLHSQQPLQDPLWAQGVRNNGRPQCWRDTTQSERLADLSDGSPWSQGDFLFPSPLADPRRSRNPTMPINSMKPANDGTYWFTG